MEQRVALHHVPTCLSNSYPNIPSCCWIPANCLSFPLTFVIVTYQSLPHPPTSQLKHQSCYRLLLKDFLRFSRKNVHDLVAQFAYTHYCLCCLSYEYISPCYTVSSFPFLSPEPNTTAHIILVSVKYMLIKLTHEWTKYKNVVQKVLANQKEKTFSIACIYTKIEAHSDGVGIQKATLDSGEIFLLLSFNFHTFIKYFLT